MHFKYAADFDAVVGNDQFTVFVNLQLTIENYNTNDNNKPINYTSVLARLNREIKVATPHSIVTIIILSESCRYKQLLFNFSTVSEQNYNLQQR